MLLFVIPKYARKPVGGSFCRGLMCYTIYWLPTLTVRKNFIS